MKSFRGEKEKRHTSQQILLAFMVLIISLIMVRFGPASVNKMSQTPKPAWESSVVGPAR